jgi:hypothetical protein
MSMTESEALKTLEDLQRLLTNYRHISKELTEANGMAISALEEVQQLHAIGTVSEFRELKEKATAKSPAYQGEHEKCPTCGSFCIGEYCIKCGQKLDWSEGKE